jgi:hypothetical protein
MEKLKRHEPPKKFQNCKKKYQKQFCTHYLYEGDSPLPCLIHEGYLFFKKINVFLCVGHSNPCSFCPGEWRCDRGTQREHNGSSARSCVSAAEDQQRAITGVTTWTFRTEGWRYWNQRIRRQKLNQTSKVHGDAKLSRDVHWAQVVATHGPLVGLENHSHFQITRLLQADICKETDGFMILVGFQNKVIPVHG